MQMEVQKPYGRLMDSDHRRPVSQVLRLELNETELFDDQLGEKGNQISCFSV